MKTSAYFLIADDGAFFRTDSTEEVENWRDAFGDWSIIDVLNNTDGGGRPIEEVGGAA